MYTFIPDGKVNGPKVEYIAVTTSVALIDETKISPEAACIAVIVLVPGPITLILNTSLLLVIVATLTLLLVYVNDPELFEVGALSGWVIVWFLYTFIPDGKVNGPKVDRLKGIYKIVFPFSNENKFTEVVPLNVTPSKVKNISSDVVSLLLPT